MNSLPAQLAANWRVHWRAAAQGVTAADQLDKLWYEVFYHGETLAGLMKASDN
jgi:hypothetical protein